MSVYVKAADLRKWVVESQEIGTMTPDLVKAVARIVDGVWRAYGFPDPDDVTQDVCVSVLLHLRKLDPSKNLFSYITQMVKNCVMKRHRDGMRQDRWR